MHKAIVPSETIGRWIDLDELDIEEGWREVPSRSMATARTNEHRGPGLRFRPFRAIENTALATAKRAGEFRTR